MQHSILKRQLKKIGLDTDNPPNAEQWKSFLERVNSAYDDADQERYLLERSLTISSQEMHEIHEQLKISETRYALAAKAANDGLWDWDLITDEVYYSERCKEILGIKPDDPHRLREWWFDRVHPEDKEMVLGTFHSHLEGKILYYSSEHRMRHCDGTYRWLLVRGIAVRNEKNEAVRFVGSFSDISERKSVEEKLAFDAVHDALTSLPNRKNLTERLRRSLERARYDLNYSFAVLFIDLDKFKTINDTLGHAAGDELLLKITEKLNNLVRPTDMVARLGGDEFVIIAENINDPNQCFQIAERIIEDTQKAVTISGHTVYSGASIGIAFSSPSYDNPEDLVRDADIAMYCAKLKGRSRVEIFDTKMHLGAVSLLQIQNELRRALENNEFVLHYQPIISLESNKVIGFESLIRWHHPSRGIVPPNDFIPVAEDCGLILPIGEWVLYEACRQLKEWQNENPQTADLMVTVNLSASQIEQKSLLEKIVEVLEITNLAPESLKLEITESVLMKNKEQAVETVTRLRDMGIMVSIDDFGTGYSSLSYLHNFPISTLKIDRSFVNRIDCENEKAEIIQTIITLAQSLGIEVVAEGVETENQLRFLRENQCKYGQGFYYSRPIDKNSVSEMLQKLTETEFEIILDETNLLVEV